MSNDRMGHPYREPQALVERRAASPRWWLRPICWVLYWVWYPGHRWQITRENPMRAMALVHFHPLAGCDAFCRRCGSVWLDADPGGDRIWARAELRMASGRDPETGDVLPNGGDHG